MVSRRIRCHFGSVPIPLIFLGAHAAASSCASSGASSSRRALRHGAWWRVHIDRTTEVDDRN